MLLFISATELLIIYLSPESSSIALILQGGKKGNSIGSERFKQFVLLVFRESRFDGFVGDESEDVIREGVHCFELSRLR